MKIKQYIVTYNNSFQINECIKSIFNNSSGEELDNLEIYIINNHSNFDLSAEFIDKVAVLNNTLRPDFSTGHLSRNWNQAIINGFVNLNKPESDIVITCQDDTRFSKNYITTTIELHKKFDLIQAGHGDNFVSYTPSAIKKVGLWDERFCGIGYQEADYFLRSYLYNNKNSSIQDDMHRRHLNKITNIPIQIIKSGCARREKYHINSTTHHEYNKKLFIKKWGFNPEKGWPAIINSISTPNIDSYIYYPYFENNIDNSTLMQQRYLLWK